MRSLIIIEVEHGDDTDDLQSYVECVGRYMESDSGNMLTFKDYAVRVGLPECFVLDK